MVTVTTRLFDGRENVCATASEGNKQAAIKARFLIQ